MKLKYLLPFLFFPFFSRNLEAQVKAEANPQSLDIKSPYFDVSARDTFGLKDLLNIKGDARLKFRKNGVYVIRNGALNHSYGGNFDERFLGAYYNRTRQSNRTEKEETQESPIGDISTRTTIIEEKKSEDFGFSLDYKGFFISYEQGSKRSEIKGSTLIKIGEDENLAPFSSSSDNKSIVYSAGFSNGFLKIIQNRHKNKEEETRDEEKFNNLLLNANYSLKYKGKERGKLSLYYGQDVSDFPDFNRRDLSGFLSLNVFQNIDFNLFYDGKDSSFTANLSTSGYSRLNQRDFERKLENRLRIAPRIYDFEVETTRRYLEDMFFTEPFSYNFTATENDITANLNLNNILFHYSNESWTVGLKYKFAIGTYDFKQNKARVGVFFGGNQKASKEQ